MSGHSINSSKLDERCHSRVGALALAALMLVTACATGSPSRRGTWTLEDEDEAVFSKLPTDFQPVRVSDSELTAALTAFWLQVPLRVSTSSAPLYVGRRLALASAPESSEACRSELAQSYGRFCQRRGTPGDCLTLFDDGPHLQANDKRSIALALAVGPALEGVGAEVRAMLNPTRVLATLSFTITAYMALLIAPEPVTKGVAVAFSVLMWGYLGWEFFDLLRAYAQLYEDAPRASTFAELHEVSERFGNAIGPNCVRILVMVATAAIGETAALLSKGPKLPGFGQASSTVEMKTGLRLMDAAASAERAIVSINEGTIRIVLPVNAVSMTERNGGGGHSSNGGSATPKEDKLLQNRHRAFKSFDAFKKAMGPAGENKAWHHIVEQRKPNVERFGPEAIHNTENVITVDKTKHDAISAYYSTKSDDTGGMVVREWLRTKSYEEQRAFGLMILRRFKAIP
ncbi:hypothetical protein [Vitiosangium sp. GDMCC 1.1324]|uniref:SitA5 family polymorphic toxin n=1 Tax=Vitiosangium sp. (strain GDMCC 1.1324) TaxID=2138576 RepID=UPI000D39D206|nr:hypothetical protein [Vitiosangium sp. GDMCC 1.1324]PTL81283.1 hypothetical protein DAT35_24525 [Vitiosangium sp. GDMCC 1.1324]